MTISEYIENVILKVTSIETVEQIQALYVDDETEMQDTNHILQLALAQEYKELATFMKNHSEIYLNFVSFFPFFEIKNAEVKA